jgi:hypothetical protein
VLTALFGTAANSVERPEVRTKQDLKIGRDHADDSDRITVELDRAPDHSGVGPKPAAP